MTSYNNKNKQMKNQIVVPVGMKLLIKEIKAETKTASGLIIPEIAQKTTYKGEVIGRGDEVEEIQIGDIVQYAEHAMPTSMTHKGKEHLLLQVGDVYAIIRYE
jgi:chaperonin GroES